MAENYHLVEFPLFVNNANPRVFCIIETFETSKEAEECRVNTDEYYMRPFKYCVLPESCSIQKEVVDVDTGCAF
mgnify:FL=1